MAGISTLQREAFGRSDQFRAQVNGMVVQQASLKFDSQPDLSEADRYHLKEVIRNPDSFGFVQTIVCDGGWQLHYDLWSENPEAQEGAILAGIQNAWPKLVGAGV